MSANQITDPHVAARFWPKVSKGQDGGCWEWTASRGKGHLKGYGWFRLGNKMERAHRVSWRITRGDIPDGMVLDHLCRNTGCVNPDHLELVTPRVNNERSLSPTAQNALKERCPLGHEYGMRGGRRVCKLCERQALRRSYRKHAGRILADIRAKRRARTDAILSEHGAAMCDLFAAGVSRRAIGAKFGVTCQAVDEALARAWPNDKRVTAKEEGWTA